MSGRLRPATVGRLVDLAREVVCSDERAYLGLLLRQAPEFLAAARRCGSSPEDLLALGLLLHRPVDAFVSELLGLVTAADPIVRRGLAA